MRKFIIQFSLFILPIVVLAYPLDILISNALRKNNIHAQGEINVWRDILDSKVNAEIAVYGSSRAWVHIDPEMLSEKFKVRSYNLGIDGHNFYLQKFRNDELTKYNIKPKLIIYSVDIFTLVKRPDLYNSDQFLPFMFWKPDFQKALESYQGFDKFDYKVPLKRYIGKYKALIGAINSFKQKNIDMPSRINGYMGQHQTWNADFDEAKKTMSDYKIQLDTNSVRGFDSFLSECKKEGIKVILVNTPEYIEGQKFVSNRNDIINMYIDFARKYSIPFYDFSTDPICYNKNYFYNAQHMNIDGSRLFTAELINKINTYYNQ